MLNKIREIIGKANPDYTIIYEEESMMNVYADELKREESFVYIEEFTRGRYSKNGYFPTKTMQMQIYFSKFCEHANKATEREALRELIESEIVLNFMREYESSSYFEAVENWDILYPPSRWDANEVSVMLYFGCKLQMC